MRRGGMRVRVRCERCGTRTFHHVSKPVPAWRWCADCRATTVMSDPVRTVRLPGLRELAARAAGAGIALRSWAQ